MKKSLDSDNDDLYDDDDDDLKHGSPTQSYQMSDRKKRRGVIEKRRRDRINNSLTELRRLVPAAFEKQGSAKLEKAEILKMAVDHLKTLNSKGLGGGYGVDTAALAMDYRMIGFRECLTEVSRYLVSIEGLDVQDPLRLRVMNHLQCYCAQRESALAKASLHPGGNAWPEPSTPYYPPAPVAGRPLVPGGHMPTGGAVLGGGPVEPMASHPPYLQDSPGAGGLTRMTHANNDAHHNRLLPSSGPPSLTLPPTSQQLNPSPYTPTSLHVCNPPTMLSGIPPSVHTPFFGSMPMLSPNGLHYNPAAPMGLGQGVRPYRPWGSDLVY